MNYQKIIYLIAFTLFSIGLNAQDLYRVTADKLKVRDTNSTESKVIGFVPQNENVAVLDSSDAKFFKIKVTNGEGWVSSEFLVRVSPMPTAKAAQPKTAPIVVPSVKSDTNYIFAAIVAVVLLGMLFLIFKNFKLNIPLMVCAALVVLLIGYFSFTVLLLEKKVSGKYATSEDLQYQSFEFKPNKRVTVMDSYADSAFTVPYETEGDMIKFKQQENTFLLMIMDDQTLVGEGFTKGIFKKN